MLVFKEHHLERAFQQGEDYAKGFKKCEAAEFDKFNHLETQLPMINIHNYVVCITTYDGKFAFISNKKAGFYHGLNQQYRGKLCGEYQRIDNEDISFPFDYRPVYNLKS